MLRLGQRALFEQQDLMQTLHDPTLAQNTEDVKECVAILHAWKSVCRLECV